MYVPFDTSIIIPTFNRPAALDKCLAALEEQLAFRSSVEVIIVDDGGTECLDFIKSKYSDCKFVFLRQHNAGAAAARNFGALHSKGAWLIFLDDDCVPSATWFARIYRAIELNPNDLVGGITVNRYKENIYSEASQSLIDFLYSCDAKRNTFLAGNHIACNRHHFLALGGFDPRFAMSAAEDRDLCARWLETERNIFVESNAILFHEHLLNFGSFLRQHFRYGQGAYLFHKLSARRPLVMPQLEGLHFYFALVSYPISRRMDNKYRIAALLCLAQFATAIGIIQMLLTRLCAKKSANNVASTDRMTKNSQAA